MLRFFWSQLSQQKKRGLKRVGGEYVAKERADISNRFEEEERGTLEERQ